MNQEKKSFKQLVDEKAPCYEFVFNGFIRLYKEGEMKCECYFCKPYDDKINNIFKKIRGLGE